MSIANYKTIIEPFFNTPKGQKYVESYISGNGSILINLDDIVEWDTQVAAIIMDDAIKYGIRAFEEAFKDAIYIANPSRNFDDLEIGFFGDCIQLIKIRDVASKHVGKIVKIRGLVSRLSQIRPFYTKVVFKCRECGEYSKPILQENPMSLMTPFGKCEYCKSSRIFDPAFEYSSFVDSQEFSLQEPQSEMVSCSIPTKLPMIAFKRYLMNNVNAGESLEVIGVVKLMTCKTRTRFNEPYIEIYHINKKSRDPTKLIISSDDEAKIKEIANRPDVFDYLVSNLAPSLFDIPAMLAFKKGCLLALFGGVERHKSDITIRGNINILGVGDPSTGKSQLLRTIADLDYNGMFATGRGTSAAGLTAALNKDERTGEWVIDAGVLVLVDKGIACIDEIDKMNRQDTVNIHEAMEQQTVTISKAGIHAKLMARAAVVAAANPLLGKYDPSKSIQENISGNFPPTLLNRFDLIFILIDKPDEEQDRLVLECISKENNEGTLDRDLFRKYIAYAKRINPILSQEAKIRLNEYFLRVRKGIRMQGKEEKIPIAYRQAEALFRIAEAHARTRLKEQVDSSDIDFTIDLFNYFLEEIEFDVTGIATGKCKGLRDMITILLNILNEHKEISHSEFRKIALERGLTDAEFQKGLRALQQDGKIYIIESGLESVYSKL